MKTILGLTGGYCSGKNRAAAIVESMGFYLIDVDKLGHRAVELCADRLKEVFGPGIAAADASIDRKALGAIVFSSPKDLALLESIVHPPMLALLDQEIAAREKVCINAALLYRFPQKELCDLIIEVRAPLWERVRRGRARDRSSCIDALKRIASQRALWKLRPRGKPPVIFVDNSGSAESLELALEKALAALPL